MTLVESDAFPAESSAERLEERRQRWVQSLDVDAADPETKAEIVALAERSFERYVRSFARTLT